MYKVFIDTNNIIKFSKTFDSGILAELRHYCREGIIDFLTTDIIISELKKNKRKPILDDVNKFISAKQTLSNKYSIIFNDIKSNYKLADPILSSLYSKIDTFFKECGSNKLSLKKLCFDKILDDYINEVPPFTKGKPYEFKDAINIQLIKSHQKQIDEMIHVISEDEGFCEAFNDIDKFKVHNNLFDFIKIVRMDNLPCVQSLALLEKYLQDEDFKKSIITGLVETVSYSISLDIFDDAEILEISDVKVNNIEFSIDGETDDLLKSGDLYISYSIEVFYEYFDPYSSPYDSETKSFVYHNIIKNTSRFDVDLVVPFVLEFEKKAPFDESKPLSQLTDLIHVDVNFAKSEVLLTDYDAYCI